MALLALAVSGAAAAALAQRRDAFVESRDHPAVMYSKGATHDPVAALNAQLERGATRLAFDATNGYLAATLEAFKVPRQSQSLVFSHTSAQAERISPQNPRAVYFNDTVAVGWVRGADVLEVAAEDPAQGVIFYTLDQKATTAPRFKRQDGCLQCHLSWDTLGVPGLMVLTTFQMTDDPNAYASGFTVDHRSPLEDRWGGWYVTGTGGTRRHRGNVPVVVKASQLRKPTDPTPHLDVVDKTFDTRGYLTPYSDIVALMVLEHQTHMTNLITRLGWETRVAGRLTPRVQEAVGDLVDYLLFVDEAPLTGRLQGTSGFAEYFSALGPRDSSGRSLRQLDLTNRLMRYPCSYMIYSPAFEALPAVVKDAVYKRLWEILSGSDTSKPYMRLTAADRRAVLEILRGTKTDLPPSFR